MRMAISDEVMMEQDRLLGFFRQALSRLTGDNLVGPRSDVTPLGVGMSLARAKLVRFLLGPEDAELDPALGDAATFDGEWITGIHEGETVKVPCLRR